MKRQREQAKREKAAAKAEKRAQKKDSGEKAGGPEIIPDDDLYVPGNEND